MQIDLRRNVRRSFTTFLRNDVFHYLLYQPKRFLYLTQQHGVMKFSGSSFIPSIHYTLFTLTLMTTTTQVVKTSVTVNTVSRDSQILASQHKYSVDAILKACVLLATTSLSINENVVSIPQFTQLCQIISQSRAPRKAIRNTVFTCPICDSTLEIGVTQLRYVTEIAPPQPFLRVNRSPIQYYFRGGAKGIRYGVKIA